MLRSQEKLLTGWEPGVEKLSRVPIHKEVAAVVNSRQGDAKPTKVTNTLLDLVNLQEVRKHGKELGVYAGDFSNKVQELGGVLESIRQQGVGLSNDIQSAWKRYVVEDLGIGNSVF